MIFCIIAGIGVYFHAYCTANPGWCDAGPTTTTTESNATDTTTANRTELTDEEKLLLIMLLNQ